MNRFIRFLLLIAAFAYGVMPMSGPTSGATAMAMTMDASMSPDAAVDTAPDMTAYMAMDHGPKGAQAPAVDPDCPHQAAADAQAQTAGTTGIMPGGHCAACLTLPPQITFADAGKPARGAEAPGLAPRLSSLVLAPQVPPPRG